MEVNFPTKFYKQKTRKQKQTYKPSVNAIEISMLEI